MTRRSVNVFRPDAAADVISCESGEPLQTRPVAVNQLHKRETFNVVTWTGDLGPPLTVQASDGSLIWGVL